MPTELLAKTEREARFRALKLAELEAQNRVELTAEALLGGIAFDVPRAKILDGATGLANALEVLRGIRESLGGMLIEDVASQFEGFKGLL